MTVPLPSAIYIVTHFATIFFFQPKIDFLSNFEFWDELTCFKDGEKKKFETGTQQLDIHFDM